MIWKAFKLLARTVLLVGVVALGWSMLGPLVLVPVVAGVAVARWRATT